MVLTAQQEIKVFKDSATISKGKQVGLCGTYSGRRH